MAYRIEIHLVGEGLAPEKMSSRDIGELIASLEQMIAPIVARDYPSLEIDEREVTIGLASVRHSSYEIELVTQYEVAVEGAYNTATRAIASGNYDTLPTKSIEAIKTVRKITRKYNTDTQFWEINGQPRQLATISPSTEIQVETDYVSGKTTLYGYVSGIIGDNPPRVRLRLLNNDIINCNVTTRDNLSVAKLLGQRLYTYVGLRGTARWDVSDMSLIFFSVEDLTEYTQSSIRAALDSLRQFSAEDYSKVEDINALIADLRGNNGDRE